MNVVYLVFGNQIELHQQANFSILTLLANGGDIGDIIVITDTPKYYQNILSEKLIIELVSTDTITAWKGKDNYVFRAKIKALEMIIDKYNTQSLLYLDADTFVNNSLIAIQEKLNDGYYVQHINEGIISESHRNTQKSIWKSIQKKTFEGIKIPQNLCMWNAGIIGIPAHNNKAYIKQVLSLSDAIYETDIKKKLVEQLSFSIALQLQENFIEAEKEIGHYWGNKKEWNTKIATFFLKNHLKNTTFKDAIIIVSDMNLQETPVMVKRSNTAKRLKTIIDRIF